MKTLTIKEPYASLIVNGKKRIETRSWKTNYRGKIYIHAGLNKESINNPKISHLIKDINFEFGNIIGEVEIIDCVYMTEEYIHELKNNNYNEYLVGEYKVGRYAWVLDNAKILDEKIQVKGKLGLWNYND